MGILKRAAEKIAEKIEEIQTCPGCGCDASRFCDSCTRSDCHCSDGA